ncbi:MAG TPA: FHA domain-containing protein [Terriglobales bacterium]|nr:FHA domain-containing protein [Terriglobales bacterium]
MAKLYLKFEQAVLKEVTVTQGGIVTVGRLPDNMIQVDNLAVSGHHAKVYWETDHYVIEDNNSLNGTFVNNQKVSKVTLKDDDNILIGKHTITFKDEWHEDEPEQRVPTQVMPAVPQMDATVVLDTKKAKELMAQARALREDASAAPAPPAAPAPVGPTASGTMPAVVPTPPPPPPPPPPPAKERTGMLTVLEGKTDEPRYVLSGKLTVIGKSAMATIKLKGSMFRQPPDVAAIVRKQDNKYFVASQDKKAHLKLNGADLDHQQELKEGDTIEVFGVKLNFEYQD